MDWAHRGGDPRVGKAESQDAHTIPDMPCMSLNVQPGPDLPITSSLAKDRRAQLPPHACLKLSSRAARELGRTLPQWVISRRLKHPDDVVFEVWRDMQNDLASATDHTIQIIAKIAGTLSRLMSRHGSLRPFERSSHLLPKFEYGRDL